ncbi:MAG: class I SAM-dependent methyltransferase [Planctomycetales bacterium]|nr:class I SAM-dependent methyltransferase [Planctomycetales bacterium]
MSALEEIKIPICWQTPPTQILHALEIAEQLRESFVADSGIKRIPALANSNYYIAYHALKYLIDHGLAGDRSFCEWGSGFGVVTCIAAMLGYEATGIEIEPELCRRARSLVKKVGVKAEFIQSSYRDEAASDGSDEPSQSLAPFPLGRGCSGVIYVYPWPAEEAYIESLFARSGSTILVTYHGGATLRVRRQPSGSPTG